MSKKFDCVAMKHKAAEKVRARIADLSSDEEIAFWTHETEALRKQQQKRIKERKRKTRLSD